MHTDAICVEDTIEELSTFKEDFSLLEEDASDDEIITTAESVAGNELKAVGKAILEGVPAIMSALDSLTEIHPFLKGNIEFCLSNPWELTCIQLHISRLSLFIASKSSSTTYMHARNY